MARTPLSLAVFLSPFTQRDLAARIGASESHLSLIINGKREADGPTRQKIADALGRSVHELWPPVEDIAA